MPEMPADDVELTRVVTKACSPLRQLMFVDYRPEGSFIAENWITNIPDYMGYWRTLWHRESTEEHRSQEFPA